MNLNAVPTINLPVKSHETPKPPERRETVRHIAEPPPNDDQPPQPIYKTFQELCASAGKLKLQRWCLTQTQQRLILTLSEPPLCVPKFELYIDEGLHLKCAVCKWNVPAESFFKISFVFWCIFF